MFELSVAKKYLLPKRGQLSVSLIALMSVGVISLVVWLVLVFLSVTDGIENSWLQKLTTLNGPVRISPTQEYLSSYYHQIDNFCADSRYSPKSIGQKAIAQISDPYQPDSDMELPSYFPLPEKDKLGNLIDPVKRAFQVLDGMKVIHQEYEIGGAMMRLQMIRYSGGEPHQSFLTQVIYVATYTDKNPSLSSLLLTSQPTDKPKPIKTQYTSAEEKSSEVWLPKQFQESGILVGDHGFLSFAAQGASSVQEQRVPIMVVGFYDPGIMAIGHKCILAPSQLVRSINLANQSFQMDPSFSNGIQVWIDNIGQAKATKAAIEKEFAAQGIDKYWKVTTYHDYDFAKDLLQQFQSDRTLFTLIGIIILGVACCNIISLLVLLVNDKKREIGILQAMGSSTWSIALIFALCGAGMGIISSGIGAAAAVLTLHNIDSLASFLSLLQGHEMFNALFYGKSLPNALSTDALRFILIATPLLSLLAGLVPALKACRLRPSVILRSEG